MMMVCPQIILAAGDAGKPPPGHIISVTIRRRGSPAHFLEPLILQCNEMPQHISVDDAGAARYHNSFGREFDCQMAGERFQRTLLAPTTTYSGRTRPAPVTDLDLAAALLMSGVASVRLKSRARALIFIVFQPLGFVRAPDGCIQRSLHQDVETAEVDSTWAKRCWISSISPML
jgi:hypothetical protein